MNIGSVSRPLTAEETKTLKTYKITEDSVCVIVNDKNPVRELTVSQLREVFSGKITNWNQVGGLNMPVTVVTRECGSGTYNVFKDIIMGEEASIDGKALVMTSTGAVLSTVMRDAGAIGYASSNYQADGVKTIEVRNGEKRAFVLIRPLMYAVQGTPGGLVEDYLAFCTGGEGKRIVEGIQKN